MPGGPHPIPFRTRSLSLPGPMVLRLKARESRSPPGLLDGCKKTHTHPNRSSNPSSTQPSCPCHQARSDFDAGWSSPVARQAHNLKVTGSNPVPAPKAFPSHNPSLLSDIPNPIERDSAGVCGGDASSASRVLRLRAVSADRSALALYQVRRYEPSQSIDREKMSLVDPSASDHQS